tara:strand:- start:427 stop:816 length:390 start_codon:yes stop_codon:yes gene_type:complete
MIETGTVYIIQQAKAKPDGWVPNLEPATQFGKLQFIFDANDKIHLDPQEALKKAHKRLKDFNPDTDFICSTQSGDPSGLWLVITYLASSGNPVLKFLYWNRSVKGGSRTNEAGFYYPVEIDCRKENLEG